MAKIPAFSLPGSDGRLHTAAEMRGRRWVLYFYPKDDTPGCTTEACDFRDRLAASPAAAAATAGHAVLGVSPDSAKRHAAFIVKHQLPFVLLADEEHVLAGKLGVWALKRNYGREYMGIVRTTFLVGPDLAILREWRGVKVKGHAEEVLAALTAGG
jgi:thioredoxin-dependent peroxiredoxin